MEMELYNFPRWRRPNLCFFGDKPLASPKELAANLFFVFTTRPFARRYSPKKQRFDDEDEDENFHTAPNSPVKGSVLAQSPL
jgi:hypothetical protein